LIGFSVVVVVLAAGCSGSGDVSTTTALVSSTTSQPTTTTVEATVDTTLVGVTPAPDGLHALVAAHNDIGLDRVNLVFVPYGWDDLDAFVDVAETLLSFDGKPVLEAGGDVQFGPFAIEPWRSNRHLFNIWYVVDEPAEPVSYTSMGEAFPINVPDAVIVTLAVDWPYGAASGFTEFIPPELPDRTAPALPVGLTMNVSSYDPLWGNPQILAHELGHAVFGLSDEYVGQGLGFDGRPDLSSFPACAEDVEEGESWWGDRLGEVDPMFSIWMQELEDAGLGLSPATENEVRSSVTVGFIDGGCYGPEGSVRATVDSLMNSGVPVLGTVNHDWAKQVLDQYTGTPRNQ